jgi:methylenetetrahydrofolate dehydrogenase (NADP+)/methenyltetrahydrofolate cyclohydrolase
MGVILDGLAVSAKVRGEVKNEVARLKERGATPGLAVIIVGDDKASRIYVNNKKKACEDAGIYSVEYSFPVHTGQDELLNLIKNLNADDKIDGILVQLPLPKHIDEKSVIESIDYNKDVDAFHSINVGKVMLGDYAFLPCTPAGIMYILDEYKIDIEGKECVIIGRSNIVGKPMAMLMLHRNATVTVCHSKTKNLSEVTSRADILISATGKPKFVTEDMVKEGAVVIDVGMNRDEEGKLCGDIDFASVEPKVSYITPVPKGVGPMTISMLLKNTVASAKIRLN